MNLTDFDLGTSRASIEVILHKLFIKLPLYDNE